MRLPAAAAQRGPAAARFPNQPRSPPNLLRPIASTWRSVASHDRVTLSRSCSSQVRSSARMAATRTIAFVFSPARSGRALRRRRTGPPTSAVDEPIVAKAVARFALNERRKRSSPSPYVPVAKRTRPGCAHVAQINVRVCEHCGSRWLARLVSACELPIAANYERRNGNSNHGHCCVWGRWAGARRLVVWSAPEA
jgi:hypothetical protein